MSSATDKSTGSKFTFDLKPGCLVYAKGTKMLDPNYLNFSCVDFIIEFKTKPKLDPFLNLSEWGESKSKSKPFTNLTSSVSTILGQLTAYTTAILSAQYHTHIFMVLIIEDYVRLIRWDHSGMIFTKLTYYNVESHLFDFFICYDDVGHEDYGHDITVILASVGNVKCAKDKIPELQEAKNLLDITI